MAGGRPGIRRRSALTATGVRPAGGAAWHRSAGAWIGVGSSPAGLVMGVSIAARHGGRPAVGTIVVAALVAAGLLYAQGLTGVQPPIGGGAPFAVVARGYLGRRSLVVLNALLLSAMVGWFGFNVGLGGTALSALVGVHPAVGAVVVGGGITAVVLAGIQRWNVLAILTAVCTLVLVGLVQWQLAARQVPVVTGFGTPGLLLGDVGAYIGFVSVFAVRAPDFSARLRARGSLAACVACVVVPMTLSTLAGVALQVGAGTTDVVALLAGSDGLAVGNLLIAVGVVAPTLAATHSGRLAAQGLLGVGERAAVALVVVPGAVLALSRFDLYLQQWLAVLAAGLPALIVPMAVEATRRRRGGDGVIVPLWTWVPAALVALALVPLAPQVAAATGLALAAVTTALWLVGRRAGLAR